MLILNSSDVQRALPMAEAIEGMKRAFAAFSGGRAEVPLRTHLKIAPHEASALFMPAYVQDPARDALAVKVVALYPGNPARGLDFIQAAVLVLEPETGRPIGLLEGKALTAIRTGAAGGAAADLFSRRESQSLALIGAGAQGRTQLEAACAVRNIQVAWIYDSVRDRSEKLARELAGVGGIPRELRVTASAPEAVTEADIVCTATTSTSALFADPDLRDGVHINAIGAYTAQMLEIPSETVKRARVFVDSRSAALAEAGDLIQPIRARLFSEHHIAAEIGDVVLGRAQGRRSESEVTLFKSVGLAVQDAVAATIAMENAVRLGIGHEIGF